MRLKKNDIFKIHNVSRKKYGILFVMIFFIKAHNQYGTSNIVFKMGNSYGARRK